MIDREADVMATIAGNSRSWLRQYVDYARTLTDAPVAFHLGAGLVALAGAIGDRLSWTGGGGRENWPNLYVLLLAPSGIYRKSTSVDLACSLLDRAAPGRVMDREFSPEQFVKNLAAQPTSVIKEAEFSGLLEQMKRDYMRGLKNRFTELYDSIPSYARVVSLERIVITRPALSIIAASTTEWLVSSLDANDLRSGFMPRFLIFSSTEQEPEPTGGYWAERNLDTEMKLVAGLASIAHRPWSHLDVREVRDTLARWDMESRQRFLTSVGREELSGVYSRLAHSTAKIMALLTIAEETKAESYVATPAIAARAMALMTWVTQRTERVFQTQFVFEKFERSAQRLLAMAEDGVDRRAVLRELRISSQQVEILVKTLKDRGQLDVEEGIVDGRKRITYRTIDTMSVRS